MTLSVGHHIYRSSSIVAVVLLPMNLLVLVGIAKVAEAVESLEMRR